MTNLGEKPARHGLNLTPAIPQEISGIKKGLQMDVTL
jgi:hypothetical protein